MCTLSSHDASFYWLYCNLKWSFLRVVVSSLFSFFGNMFNVYRPFLCWTYCEHWKNLGGLQVGGGINLDNCLSYIDEGASHVIVTSVCWSIFNIISCKVWNPDMYRVCWEKTCSPNLVYVFLLDLLQYVFNNGKMDLERLKGLVNVIGKQRLVLDLSCRKKVGNISVFCTLNTWRNLFRIWLLSCTFYIVILHYSWFLSPQFYSCNTPNLCPSLD